MPDDETTTEALRIEQIERERSERERSEHATSEAEEKAASRRADKASYLKEKLGEQARNPDERG